MARCRKPPLRKSRGQPAQRALAVLGREVAPQQQVLVDADRAADLAAPPDRAARARGRPRSASSRCCTTAASACSARSEVVVEQRSRSADGRPPRRARRRPSTPPRPPRRKRIRVSPVAPPRLRPGGAGPPARVGRSEREVAQLVDLRLEARQLLAVAARGEATSWPARRPATRPHRSAPSAKAPTQAEPERNLMQLEQHQVDDRCGSAVARRRTATPLRRAQRTRSPPALDAACASCALQLHSLACGSLSSVGPSPRHPRRRAGAARATRRPSPSAPCPP